MHHSLNRGTCSAGGRLEPRDPGCPDTHHLSAFCFSFPFFKVGMMLVTSLVRLWEARCHQLGDRIVRKLREALLFPIFLGEDRCPSPSSTGSRAESTSKEVTSTHSTEASSAGTVQCIPSQCWTQGRPQIPHSCCREPTWTA